MSSKCWEVQDARNTIEHLDERMDNWLGKVHRNFLESVLDDNEALDFYEPDRWAIRRMFLLDSFSFVVEENRERKTIHLAL